MIAEKIAFLQDDEFTCFVEPAEADYIIACATNAGHEIELGEDFFNFVYASSKTTIKVAAVR
jgi:hypothetical protein